MKHKIFVLGLILSCLLGLTACGSEINYDSVEGSRYHPDYFTKENIEGFVKTAEDEAFESWYLNGITPETFEENLYFTLGLNLGDDVYEVYRTGYESWYKAVEDIGYDSPSSLKQDIYVSNVTYYINGNGELVVDGTIQGTKHSALFEIYFANDFSPTNMGVTVNKSTGEKLQNAGLNTLLGMGMAFAVLILISLIICLFPVFFGTGKKKKESDKEIAQKAIENTVSQIADKEDLSGDSELVAVIAAAIAAYEGSASTDGFTVRSIRKVNKGWKNR